MPVDQKCGQLVTGRAEVIPDHDGAPPRFERGKNDAETSDLDVQFVGELSGLRAVGAIRLGSSHDVES